jgi:dihydrofolate synthase/folylpolyglutamate synthase
MYDLIRYRKAVTYLEGLGNLPVRPEFLANPDPAFFLKRKRYFLNLIGNPAQHLKFIHLGGTAGKGSVTALLHEILYAADKKVGSFTTPFVSAHIEEIKVNGRFIAPSDFADIVEYLQPFIDHAHVKGPYGAPSPFETKLAIALIYFLREQCDWVILEVGMGGMFDATNAISAPAVSAITSVDLDHTESLGKTRTKIARDKAGIIKKGSVFFTVEQSPAIKRIFSAACKKQGVPCVFVPQQESYRARNVALATAIARHLQVPEAAIARGVERMRLPARFEKVSDAPLVVLDGAHNPLKMKTVTPCLPTSYRLPTVFSLHAFKACIVTALLPRCYIKRQSDICANALPPRSTSTPSKRLIVLLLGRRAMTLCW